MSAIEVRRRDSYKPADLWIPAFIWFVGLFRPRWKAQVLERYATFSVFTNTVYANYTPSEALLVHEAVHGYQYATDGVRMPIRYVLRPLWRIRYEVEAYRADGRYSPAEVAAKLKGAYLLGPFWPLERVEAQVLEEWNR